ncbi:MAG: AEC family transporter, partial [Candidatus Electrothrix sp. AUS4]|nr:AEC family transporter [Candidatus Electrothrix sp. AUS4]
MDNFIITITFLLIGMLIKRLPNFPDTTGTVLNLFVIYISPPN